MVTILSGLLLIALALIIWGWNNYVRIIPLSSDRFVLLSTATGQENPRLIQQIKERGGMTRKEWSDFVDRNYTPPSDS